VFTLAAWNKVEDEGYMQFMPDKKEFYGGGHNGEKK
jgi:hypothetical protein